MITYYKGKPITELTEEELREALILYVKYTNELLNLQRKIQDINTMRYKDKKGRWWYNAR